MPSVFRASRTPPLPPDFDPCDREQTKKLHYDAWTTYDGFRVPAGLAHDPRVISIPGQAPLAPVVEEVVLGNRTSLRTASRPMSTILEPSQSTGVVRGLTTTLRQASCTVAASVERVAAREASCGGEEHEQQVPTTATRRPTSKVTTSKAQENEAADVLGTFEQESAPAYEGEAQGGPQAPAAVPSTHIDTPAQEVLASSPEEVEQVNIGYDPPAQPLHDLLAQRTTTTTIGMTMNAAGNDHATRCLDFQHPHDRSTTTRLFAYPSIYPTNSRTQPAFARNPFESVYLVPPRLGAAAPIISPAIASTYRNRSRDLSAVSFVSEHVGDDHTSIHGIFNETTMSSCAAVNKSVSNEAAGVSVSGAVSLTSGVSRTTSKRKDSQPTSSCSTFSFASAKVVPKSGFDVNVAVGPSGAAAAINEKIEGAGLVADGPESPVAVAAAAAVANVGCENVIAGEAGTIADRIQFFQQLASSNPNLAGEKQVPDAEMTTTEAATCPAATFKGNGTKDHFVPISEATTACTSARSPHLSSIASSRLYGGLHSGITTSILSEVDPSQLLSGGGGSIYPIMTSDQQVDEQQDVEQEHGARLGSGSGSPCSAGDHVEDQFDADAEPSSLQLSSAPPLSARQPTAARPTRTVSVKINDFRKELQRVKDIVKAGAASPTKNNASTSEKVENRTTTTPPPPHYINCNGGLKSSARSDGAAANSDLRDLNTSSNSSGLDNSLSEGNISGQSELVLVSMNDARSLFSKNATFKQPSTSHRLMRLSQEAAAGCSSSYGAGTVSVVSEISQVSVRGLGGVNYEVDEHQSQLPAEGEGADLQNENQKKHGGRSGRSFNFFADRPQRAALSGVRAGTAEADAEDAYRDAYLRCTKQLSQASSFGDVRQAEAKPHPAAEVLAEDVEQAPEQFSAVEAAFGANGNAYGLEEEKPFEDVDGNADGAPESTDSFRDRDRLFEHRGRGGPGRGRGTGRKRSSDQFQFYAAISSTTKGKTSSVSNRSASPAASTPLSVTSGLSQVYCGTR